MLASAERDRRVEATTLPISGVAEGPDPPAGVAPLKQSRPLAAGSPPPMLMLARLMGRQAARVDIRSKRWGYSSLDLIYDLFVVALILAALMEFGPRLLALVV